MALYFLKKKKDLIGYVRKKREIINELKFYRTWRRQLLVAKETRRVDELCLRISLGHKILLGTELFKDLQKTVETALQILTNEVGPLNLLCTKMARGIVSRLSCGAEVQKLCSSAVEALDSMFLVDAYPNNMGKKEPARKFLKFLVFAVHRNDDKWICENTDIHLAMLHTCTHRDFKYYKTI